MDKKHYQTAKAHLVARMQEGQAWQRASAAAVLQISRSNAYRLRRAFRLHGEAELSDGRHGHPGKLRGEARAFLEERCRQAPHTPSSMIQMEMQEHFGLHVSISQINRVRALLGLHQTSRGPAAPTGAARPIASTQIHMTRVHVPSQRFASIGSTRFTILLFVLF